MKKHLGWVLRLLIAAAGVGYIVYTLNWSDQVYLPAGYDTGQGLVEQEGGQSYPVTEKLENGYAIAFELGDGSRINRYPVIPFDALVDAGEGPRFEPSFMTILGGADLPLMLGGLAVFAPVFLVGALRWNLLMRARGIEIGFLRTYRLTMAGLFFNLCMPGTTGGDVMKAYYAAKGTRQRADAVVSVGVDRVCGLIGLIVLVALVGLLSLDDALIRKITIGMWAVLGGLVLLALLYTNRRLRARLALGRLEGKVPGAGALRKLDALVTAYRHHPKALIGAVALSVPIHLSLACSMALAGYALGVDRPLLVLLGVIPIVFMLWSLPVSGPLGLGPLEIVAVHLIAVQGEATQQQVLVMFVAYRLFTVAVGLAGSLALLGSGGPSASVPTEADDVSESDTAPAAELASS